MNNPFDHIEEYLAGELSPKDMQYFEKVLLENTALRNEVEMVKELELFAQRKADNQHALDVVKGVMEEGRREEEGRSSESGDELEGIEDGREESGGRDEELGDERQHEENGLKEEGKEKSWSFVKLVVGVAMVAMLALLVWVVVSKENSSIESEQLYVQNFRPEQASFSTKTDVEYSNPTYYQADSILQIAEFNFNQKNYHKSIEHFDIYHDLVDSLNPEAQYFKSVALLGEKKPKQALLNFDLMPDNSLIYENDIKWYKGLAHLLLKDYLFAEQSLSEIAKSSVRFDSGQGLSEQLSKLTPE